MYNNCSALCAATECDKGYNRDQPFARALRGAYRQNELT